MALIWTDEDVATLLQAFPPPTPSKEQPSLLRSHSGQHLVQSKSAVSRLEKVLATSNARISYDQLDTELDFRGADQLLGLVSSPVYRSHTDKQGAVIPRAVAQDILQELWIVSGERVVEYDLFGLDKDIDQASLKELVKESEVEGKEWMPVHGDDGKERICRSLLYEQVKNDVAAAMRDANAERCDLNRYSRGLPTSKVEDIGKNLMSEDETLQGAIEQVNDSVVFIPTAYTQAQRTGLMEAYSRLVNDLSSKLESNGFIAIDPSMHAEQLQPVDKENDDLIKDVRKRCGGEDGTQENDAIETLGAKAKTILVKRKTLEAAVSELNTLISEVASDSWKSRESGAPVPSFDVEGKKGIDELAEASPHSEIYELLLESTYHEEMAEVYNSRMQNLAKDERIRFVTFFQEMLAGPVELYARGVSAASDATLKQHLEEFIGDHFRREALPESLKTAKTEGLLKDKTRGREIDKMSQACGEAKTLLAISSSVQKCARKLKVETPSPFMLAETKKHLLEQRVQVLRKVKRGSDVLQNLIWVLLARETEGLFMSSGKDTTRMVKLYAAAGGDAEVTKKLEGWKEALKNGQETKEVVGEMRELGVKSAEEVIAG